MHIFYLVKVYKNQGLQSSYHWLSSRVSKVGFSHVTNTTAQIWLGSKDTHINLLIKRPYDSKNICYCESWSDISRFHVPKALGFLLIQHSVGVCPHWEERAYNRLLLTIPGLLWFLYIEYLPWAGYLVFLHTLPPTFINTDNCNDTYQAGTWGRLN